jgi:hypothetical protein
VVGERVILREVTLVGDYSYFERHAEAIYTTIGKFCSIAANTRINALEHPIERHHQHKVSYRPNEFFRYLGVDAGDFRERRAGLSSVIDRPRCLDRTRRGVMPGVMSMWQWRCGRCQRVVTRDVAPFEIVAGVPAKPAATAVRSRSAAASRRLPGGIGRGKRLFEAMPDMQSLPIEAFLDTLGSEAGLSVVSKKVVQSLERADASKGRVWACQVVVGCPLVNGLGAFVR